jgi:GDP-4-dehydro-6-deoxy-D-mannose reductase
VVTALSRGPAASLPEGVVGVAADLLKADSTARAVAETAPEVVFHLAAQASVAQSLERPAETIQSNVAMAVNLLAAVSAHAPDARVVIVGSGEIYGPPASLPLDEQHPLRPQNPYAVSKASTDLLAGYYADARGLDVVRSRSFNHAGPGQSDTYVLASLARQLANARLTGERPARIVTGNADVRRDFTDVRDVVAAYRALAGAPAGAYNVCSGAALSIAELIVRLGELARWEIDHSVNPALVREHEVLEVRGSHAKITEATGWEPEIPLDRTLSDTLAWWTERLKPDA